MNIDEHCTFEIFSTTTSRFRPTSHLFVGLQFTVVSNIFQNRHWTLECNMMKKTAGSWSILFSNKPTSSFLDFCPYFCWSSFSFEFPQCHFNTQRDRTLKSNSTNLMMIYFFKIFLGHTSRTVTLTIFFLTMFCPLQWHLVVVSLLLVTEKFFPPGEKDGKNHPKLVISKWHIIGSPTLGNPEEFNQKDRWEI